MFVDWYIFMVNVCIDVFFKFGVNYKWGFFLFVLGVWVVSEEKFMKCILLVDNLKFCIGYGLVGNQSGIDFYMIFNLVKFNGVVFVGSL